MNIDRLYIDGYDVTNLGFWLTWRNLSAPAVRSSYETIPAAHGSVDTTEANGAVYFEMRELECDCKYMGENWHGDLTALMERCHGKKCQIAFANDPDYYWTGRVSVSSYDSKDRSLSMNATVFPFKFAAAQTVVEESITDSGTVTLENHGRMTVVPEVTTDAAIELAFGSSSASIQAGTFTVAGLEIGYGESLDVTITGTANVSFAYREATL